MTIAQVGTTQTFAFADGNGGHSCNFGSAPSVGDFDVLCINSDTVVASAPSGFSLAATAVNNQGSYIYYREAVGGESSSVTITTSGNFNTDVLWLRWSGAAAFDVGVAVNVDATVGSGTPSATTAALAGTGELAIVFAALSNDGTANQTSPTWTSGFTSNGAVAQGSGTNGVAGLVASQVGVGAAAVTAQCTGWTGDGAFNRYTLIATFTPSAGGETLTLSATAPAPTAGITVVSNTLQLAGTAPAPTSDVQVNSATVQLAMTGPAPAADIEIGIPGTVEALMAAPGPTMAGHVASAAPDQGDGSWWQIGAISTERIMRYEEERARPPVACVCGEPLRTGPHGELYCPFDGRQYPMNGPAY